VELLNQITEAIIGPIGMLVDPAQRIFLPGLVLSFGIAFLVLWRRRKHSRDGIASRLMGVIPASIYGHRSARLDYKLLFAKSLIRTLLIAPWLFSTYGLAVWTYTALHGHFGVASSTGLSTVQIVSLYTVCLFVAWDLSRYILHRLMHRIPCLWELHKVHHSAEVLTPFTLYRNHPIESLLYSLRGILVTGLMTGLFFYLFGDKALQMEFLGVNALGFVFSTIGSNLRHSHVWISYGPFLEKHIISPAQHQIHHSQNAEHFDRNFGTWLALWDRIGGSLYVTKGEEALELGLSSSEQNHDPHRLGSTLYQPMVAALRSLVSRKPMGGLLRSRALVGILFFGLVFVGTTNPVFAQQKDSAPIVIEIDDEDDESPKKIEKKGALVIDTVSIIGEREKVSRVAGSNTTIQKEALERFQHDDIHRVLEQAPGVYVRGEDGYGLRPNIGMRGASSDRSAKINLMEDGILIGPAPYSAPAAYYFPMMARIAGVEVFKGPSSIKYGPNTIGGALNFQTRPIPRHTTTYIDLAYGQHNVGRLHSYVGTSGNRWGFLLEGAHLQTDGFKTIDGGGDSGFMRDEIVARGRYHTNPAAAWFHQLDLRAGYSRERSNETYLGLTDDDFESTPYRRYAASQLGLMEWPRTEVRLGYTLSHEESLEFNLVGYRHDFTRNWRKLRSFRGGPAVKDILANPGTGQSAVYYAILTGQEDSSSSDQTLLIGSNDRTYVSQGVAFTGQWRPEGSRFFQQEISFGARLHTDHIERNHTDEGYSMIAGGLVRDETEQSTVTRNKGVAQSLALHLYDEIRVGELSFSPGFRAEFIRTNFEDFLADTKQSNSDTVLIPGVGIHYQASSWLGLLAGVHKGFSPVAPGQPDEVKPEQSINYEGGFRITSNQTRAEVVGFFNDYSNLTGECTFSSGCSDDLLNRQFNAGDVHVYGLETSLTQNFKGPGASRIWTSLFYTLTLSDFQSAFTSGNPLFGDVEKGDKLPYVPVHQGTVIAGLNWNPFEFNASMTYTGDMRDVAGQGSIESHELIAQHLVVDLSSSFQLSDGFRIYATAQNVLNSSYMVSRRPYGARPGKPFEILVGLKYDGSN